MKYIKVILFFLIGLLIYFLLSQYQLTETMKIFQVLTYLIVVFVLEKIREEENILKYYLIDIPFLFLLLGLWSLWYFVPVFYYFSNSDSIYYTFCLEILGGVVGELIWINLYLFGWGYIGYKIYRKCLMFVSKYFKK